jgi:hypothetical protein
MPYVYNLELLESMLEQKAKSSMSRRRKAPRDLDRLYMTSSAYKEHRLMRSSVPEAALGNITERNSTELRSSGHNYEAIAKQRH